MVVTGLNACATASPPAVPCATRAEPASSSSAPGGAARPTAANATGVNPETIEPKLGFVLHLGATSVAVTEGEAARARGDFRDPTVAIDVSPERTFALAGLRFAYPRQFVFEADLASSASQSWVLSGNDLKIMVFRFSALASLDLLAEAMVQRFGADASSSTSHVTLAGTDYESRRIEATVTHHEMIMDVVGLPPIDGKSRFLVLQDAKESQGAESAAARQLLERTFRIEH
jgi:hypothetical protein